MYASGYIFSRTFFVAWIVVAIIWVWGTMLVAGFYPIIDGASQLKQVYLGLRYGKNVRQNDKESETVEAEVSVLQREGK